MCSTNPPRQISFNKQTYCSYAMHLVSLLALYSVVSRRLLVLFIVLRSRHFIQIGLAEFVQYLDVFRCHQLTRLMYFISYTNKFGHLSGGEQFMVPPTSTIIYMRNKVNERFPPPITHPDLDKFRGTKIQHAGNVSNSKGCH